MKKSYILKESKKYLWDGVQDRGSLNKFICFAVAETCCTLNDLQAISDRISCNIKGYVSYRAMLVDERGCPSKDISDEEVQMLRHKLVDKLIAEYEAEGD